MVILGSWKLLSTSTGAQCSRNERPLAWNWMAAYKPNNSGRAVSNVEKKWWPPQRFFSEQLSQEDTEIASHPYKLPTLCGSDEADMPFPVLSWNSAFTSSLSAYNQVCIITLISVTHFRTKKNLLCQQCLKGLRSQFLLQMMTKCSMTLTPSRSSSLLQSIPR